MKKRLLLIDDEQMILDAMQIVLQDLGFDVQATADPEAGMQMGVRESFDLIVTDVRMPAIDGARIVETIRSARPEARIVIATAYPGDPLVERALRAGAMGVLTKPYDFRGIVELVLG